MIVVQRRENQTLEQGTTSAQSWNRQGVLEQGIEAVTRRENTAPVEIAEID